MDTSRSESPTDSGYCGGPGAGDGHLDLTGDGGLI